MDYTIGEFASLVGVTTDTLRLYEKYGIIKPRKNENNNYRYYNDLDARNLLMSRWYRSMEIPLQDVASLTNEPSLDLIAQRINETRENLTEEISRKTKLLNKIINISEHIKKIEPSLYRCKIKEMPGIYRLKQTNRNSLLKDDDLRGIVNKWMDVLPHTFYSFRIGINEILSKDKAIEYSWGLAIAEDEIKEFDLEINEHVEYIDPKTYVSSIILSPNEDSLLQKSLDFMLDYIRENHYALAGDIIGKIIFTEKINNEKRSYLEVNIPIEQTSL